MYIGRLYDIGLPLACKKSYFRKLYIYRMEVATWGIRVIQAVRHARLFSS